MNILRRILEDKRPILWDRLFLVLMGNIFIAMGIIALIDWHSWESAAYSFALGVIIHSHYWRGGRFLIKLDGNDGRPSCRRLK